MPCRRNALSAGVACGLLFAAPVQAQTEAPGGGPIARAQAMQASGDTRAAIAALETARSERPDDPTLLRLLGTYYAYDGRYDAAIDTLRAALERAPADDDIRLALARAHYWSGNRLAARSVLDPIAPDRPAHGEASELRRLIATPAPAAGPSAGRRGGAYISQSVAAVDSAARDTAWFETIAGGYGIVAPDTTIGLEVAHADRDFATDTTLTARLGVSPFAAARIEFDAGWTPGADFRAEWRVGAAADITVAPGIAMLASGRLSSFAIGETFAFEPGLRIAPGNGPVALSARMINLWDVDGEHRTGWSGRIDWTLPRDRLIFVGAATYPDTEAGITRQMRGVYGGLVIPTRQGVTLRVTGEYEDREQSYDRTALTLGLGLGF